MDNKLYGTMGMYGTMTSNHTSTHLIATINIFLLARPSGYGYQMFLKSYPIPWFAFLLPLSRWLHHNKK